MGENYTIESDCPDKEVHNLWRYLRDNVDFYNAFQLNPKQALIDYALTDEVNHTLFDEDSVSDFPSQDSFANALCVWGDELLDKEPDQNMAQTHSSYILAIDGPPEPGD